MQSEINPWSSNQDIETNKLFSEFGIEPVEPLLDKIKNTPAFLRRNIVTGQRDYARVVDAMAKKEKFFVMTGFMPSGHPHLGHLMVMKEVAWHVKQGGLGYVAIADREAHAVRDISWEKCREYGKEYLKCLYALGFEGNTYFQSNNNDLKDLAFESATKINFSDLQAIYGFSQDSALAKAMSVSMQVADILYPQTDDEPAPTVVPVGLDQDPHIRLTRDVSYKLRMFIVEERCEGNKQYISIRSKNAPAKAMEELASEFPGASVYEGHIDLKDGDPEEIREIVRKVEIRNGGYGFISPSATYHTFLQGLQGGKMSSSVPESLFGFYEDEKSVKKKIMGALTGGRMTLEEQKKLGGEPDKCSIYLLNLFHMTEDDAELNEIYCACKEGELMCGTCKKQTFGKVKEFLSDFKDKMDECEHKVEV